jgi:membrane protein YdbS with pleckstrin-like domain
MRFHLNHWVLTLIAGAIFVTGVLPILQGNGLPALEALDYGFLTFIVSIPLSLPVAVLYFIAGYAVNLAPVNITAKKAILITLAVAGIFITFKMIGAFLDSAFFYSYAAATILTGIFLKME